MIAFDPAFLHRITAFVVAGQKRFFTGEVRPVDPMKFHVAIALHKNKQGWG